MRKGKLGGLEGMDSALAPAKVGLQLAGGTVRARASKLQALV